VSAPFEAFRDRRQAVLEALRALEAHAAAIGASTLAQRLGRELCGKLEQDRFNLVVVGEFNHGKTSFVNALLGTAALPTGVTPTTACIHHVSHADEPRATVVHEDGEERSIAFDDLADYVVRGDGDGDAAAVKHIDVGYPAELLRERIVLVDTPGVNDLCLQRADITYKYIPQADAVLFVIDAGQPLKESERLFIEDKLIGQSRDKIIFVVAKADIWSQQEHEEALAYVRDELSKLVESPAVFPVSPQKALSGERELSGIDTLTEHISRFLAEERGRIVLDNALGDALEAGASLAHAIDAKRRAAHMTSEEIERRIARIEADLEGQKRSVDQRRAAIREEVSAIRAWLRRDLDRFCDDVIRQLPELVERASIDELKLHLAGFLEATFVRWAENEADEVARALETLAEKTVALMRDDAHDSAKRLSEQLGADVRSPDVQVDTFGYDVGVAALFSVGLGVVFTNAMLGALMAGAAPVLAYYLKGKVESETRAKALEQASLALREAATKIAPKLDEMVDDFAERLDGWVAQAGQEVHHELLDVLRAARRDRADVEPDLQQAEAACDELATELGALNGRFAELRATLWGVDEPAAV
jgi:predicted GTPase